MFSSGRSLFLFFSLIVATYASAQSAEQWIAWGDAAFERGEYYGATRFYNGALAADPGRMSTQWKQAEASRLSNQYGEAATFYEKVQRKDNGRTHPEALRWLAEMYMCQGRYSEAQDVWRKVLQRTPDKASFAALRAQNGLAGCALANDSTTDKDIAVEHLPQPVNSFDSEFGARIGPDSSLYFTTLRGTLNKEGEVEDTLAYHTSLYRSREQGATWEEPRSYSRDPANDIANATWTTDGKWILFTRCASGAGCRIHIAPVSAAGMGEAHVLPGIGDTLHSTQAMVVQWDHREMLLFVSDRPGGEGGMDIWQCELVDGEAKYIYPLGRPVNTPGDERCPWYDAPTNTLWYSSDFLPGLGGFDIFSAAFGNDVFANPVNAGRPINGPANDLYPLYAPLRGEGWFTSNRIGSFAAKGETCCNDLYRFRFPPQAPVAIVQTPIDDPEPTRQPTSAERLLSLQERFPLKLYFHNDDPDPRSWNTTTPQTYDEAYQRYKALRPEYERENEDPMRIQDFLGQEVDHGRRELDTLAFVLWPVLEEGRSVTIDVRGHASPLAKNNYNVNLSLRRIESLRNHLRAADGGRLATYLDGTASNGARLLINALPFGEDRSAQGVSDALGDLKRSVYSVEAARERRIEVEALQLLQRTTNVEVDRQVAQLGELTQNMERITPFTIRNDGDTPMRLLHAEPDCGCTTAALPEDVIPPGGTAVINVVFNGHAAEGPLRRTVVIDTDGVPKRFELIIEGQLVP